MDPTTVVLGPGEGVLSSDAVPFAASPTIINENIRADTWIPEQELWQRNLLGIEQHRASFYRGGMGDCEVHSSEPSGKQQSDCRKPIVGKDRHPYVPPCPCLAVGPLWPCCRSPLFLYSKVTARSWLYVLHSSCGQICLDSVTESKSGPSWLMLNIEDIICMITCKLQDVSWPSLGD